MENLPDLTVVIPTLDDRKALRELLDDLGRQERVFLEVVVVEGRGSVDATGLEPFGGHIPVRLVVSPPGRARQMNLGAAGAAAPDLLSLHADTRVEDPLLFFRAREHMEAERAGRRSRRIAGHFALRFRRRGEGAVLAYHFYEAKTRLCRAECVNGDQGFWIARSWFDELGGFDESLPFLEDARLAAKVAARGEWILLPGWVWTSARRFEAEGLLQRQTVNALVRTFEGISEPSFFGAALDLYRSQPEASPMDLQPFLSEAHRVLWAGSPRQCAKRLARVGSYVRRQAWQLALWLDVARSSGRASEPGGISTGFLRTFEPAFDRLTDNPAGRTAAAVLAVCWLYGALLWLGMRRLLPSRARREPLR